MAPASVRVLCRLVSEHQIELGWSIRCPGCGEVHRFYCEGSEPGTGMKWRFNGSMEAPTFLPGFTQTKDGKLCHGFVQGGKIYFNSTSAHELAGKFVAMAAW